MPRTGRRKENYIAQWLHESINQPSCCPENFKVRREYILGMSREQCATWLKTHRSTVVRWEEGKVRIPFAAYEVMRLLAEHVTYQRQNDKWLGWKFTKAGELVNPDGNMIFTPERLIAIEPTFWLVNTLETEKSQLKNELTEANQEIERLRNENIQLRYMAAADTMVDELHSIKDHVDCLLSLVDRAKVYEFPAGRAAA